MVVSWRSSLQIRNLVFVVFGKFNFAFPLVPWNALWKWVVYSRLFLFCEDLNTSECDGVYSFREIYIYLFCLYFWNVTMKISLEAKFVYSMIFVSLWRFLIKTNKGCNLRSISHNWSGGKRSEYRRDNYLRCKLPKV